MHRCALLIGLGVVLVFGGIAHADVRLLPEGWTYPVGLSVGGHRDDAGDRMLVGVDASAIYFTNAGAWLGPTVDLRTSTDSQLTALGVGAAVGYYGIGADVSYVVANEDRATIHGVRGRAVLSIGLVGVVGGYTARANANDALEISLIVKWPFPLRP